MCVCVTSAWNEFDVCFLVSFRTTLSSSFVLTCIILHMCLPMCEVMTDHVTIVAHHGFRGFTPATAIGAPVKVELFDCTL